MDRGAVGLQFEFTCRGGSVRHADEAIGTRYLDVGAALLVAGLRLRGPRAFELELLNLADLREERHEREPDEPPVVRHHCLHVDRRALVEHRDHRLLSRCEVAHDRDDRGHERPLAGVGHEGLLAIEERDLRSLHHVGPRVALGSLDQEVGLDVREDREAEVRGARGRVGEAREARYGGAAKAVLTEGDRKEVLASGCGRAVSDTADTADTTDTTDTVCTVCTVCTVTGVPNAA